jgi:WhiB family redox-sensing transcriptional regulator
VDGDEELARFVLLVREQRPAWQKDASCLEHPEHSWFPGQGVPTAPVQAICHRCLVVDECRAYAAEDRSLHGVWGGTTHRERTRPLERRAA